MALHKTATNIHHTGAIMAIPKTYSEIEIAMQGQILHWP
jgi:hypothetical protein